MEVTKTVIARRSIRAFKPDPVPGRVLEEIMQAALRAPSWANMQPWEFAVAAGTKLAEIKKRYSGRKGADIKPDFTQFLQSPEPYHSRSMAAILKSHDSVGIKREDRQQREWWEQRQLNNFDAPCEIYIYIDRALFRRDGEVNIWPVYDCGAIAGMIALLAVDHGLGTITQARAVVYPDILREVLGIPDTKLMLIGLAIGYPDLKNPVNQYTTDREPLDTLVHWHGFA